MKLGRQEKLINRNNSITAIMGTIHIIHCNNKNDNGGATNP
jgi:hypothetical protein